MEQKQKKKLDSLLSTFDIKQTDIKREVDKKQQERNLFLEQFEKLCNERIKPIMEEIGSVLKDKGHDYHVNYSKETKGDKGATIDARICMDIFPKGKGKTSYSEKAAHVMFFADKYNNEIGIHENTITPTSGGSAGAKPNKYTAQTLTTEKVEEEIVESLDKIFNNKF